MGLVSIEQRLKVRGAIRSDYLNCRLGVAELVGSLMETLKVVLMVCEITIRYRKIAILRGVY